MLTENDIVNILAKHLENKGYAIKQTLTTSQTGIDLIAENDKEILFVEAKGETSSKQSTNRYGLGFDSNQIKSHVSRAILASMIVLQSKPAGPKTNVAIALPDNHRDIILKITNPLKSLGIKVYLITGDRKVDCI
jgi:Holliday junction resolvase-like predicted endonuclease